MIKKDSKIITQEKYKKFVLMVCLIIITFLKKVYKLVLKIFHMIPYGFYYFGPLLDNESNKKDLNKVKKILSKKGYHMKKI